MAFLAGLFCSCLVVLASMHGLVYAERVFKVGDRLGWQEPEANNSRVYIQWASRNRFQVGDSLSFEYKNDSVVQVDKWGYYHCNTTQPIAAFDSGNSVIQLDSPGPFYFISGTPEHCRKGQRLLVEVMGLHHHGSQSPPSIAFPPDSYLAPTSHPSSGVSLSVTFGSVSVVVAAAFVAVLWPAP